jgi:hypothetical protein
MTEPKKVAAIVRCPICGAEVDPQQLDQVLFHTQNPHRHSRAVEGAARAKRLRRSGR